MRVYLPATSTLLGELHERGLIGPAPLTGFAVTPGIREWYVDEDVDELEYAASGQAARASVRLIDADPSALRRRVVLSVDVPDEQITVADGLERGAVRISTAVPASSVAAVHVDDADAEEVVGAAAVAVIEADLGSEAAQQRVDDAEGYELSWYAPQELADVVAHLQQ
ncbi:MAG: DUF6912 family protein [Jatrophihabitans sp.]